MHVNTVHMFSIIIVVFRCMSSLGFRFLLNTKLYVYLLIVLFIYNPEFMTKIWLIFSSFIQTKKQILKALGERRVFLIQREAGMSNVKHLNLPFRLLFGTWADRIWTTDKKWKILNNFDLFIIFKMQITAPPPRSTHRASCHKALPE